MIGSPVRDPVGDHLLTPQNAALIVIDYQPLQRDWARGETVNDAIEIVLTDRLLKA